jgi:UDP-N-acetylglucosamine acyltransferase
MGKTQIDPSARVQPGAELGDDVVIGPWCQVGPQVRLGDGCILDSMVVVDGWTELGPGCRLHHGAVVGTAPQDLKYAGARTRCQVGGGTVVREYATINRSTTEDEPTVIGERCLIMSYAHVAHNCRLGNQVILANSANLAGHVTIDDWAIVGGVTPVHQFVKVGAHVMIGGGSRVPADVAPYLKAAGSPLRVVGLNKIGLERRGFAPETIAALERLYRIFFRSSLLKEEAVARIRRELPALPEIEAFLDFVERSERGLARPGR